VKPSIFAVEDDSSLRELYTYMLEGEYNCRCFESGGDFFAALENELPNLILLDIMLPGEDGFAILSRLKARRATARVPVILISAKGEELSKVRGLNMGADDYIAKPFGVPEFLARVRAALRKNAAVPGGAADKDIVVDEQRHAVTIAEKGVDVTPKEFALLRLLAENAGSVCPREGIFDELWGTDFAGETRTLDIHIASLRKKLAGAGSAAAIKTVRSVGYMLQ
jgi:two-component system alkaline phosphatase synthesis response regulator PhoP